MQRRPFAAPSSLSLTPRTARELAYRVLERHRQTGDWVQDALLDEFARGAWSLPDRRLVTELVCGVVRRQATLTALLRPAISRPWERIEPELVTLLWLGAYQLIYLDRVPVFAAIHETVEIARSIGQTRWTGFANGVLRSVSRVVRSEFGDSPAAIAVPVGNGRYRLLHEAVLPDPATDFADYVSWAFSLPEWLVQRWTARFERQQMLQIAEGVNASPQVYVRVNRRRTTTEELQELWTAAGFHSERVERVDALRLFESGPIEELPGYAEGLFSPQDLTAMQAAVTLSPGPDERVWDVCAAPGTKACHLAELRDDHGVILATDVHPDRLSLVTAGAERLGLTSICAIPIRDDLLDLPRGPFDAILVDAPCSNTGVLHRRPEARWRLRAEDCTELAEIQTRLLRAAVERLAPGGRVLYSTCSIEPEENESVVTTIRHSNPALQLVSERLYFPGPDGDGGYQSLLRLDA